MISRFKSIVSSFHYYFLNYRYSLVQQILPIALVISVIIGAGYRSIVLKERFEYSKEGFGYSVSMASNYRKAPGMYSWDEYMFTREKPDEYIYTVGKSKFEPMSPSNSEIGWGLILHLILKDGIKGLPNIALSVARYQLMMELSIIVLLFWAGKRVAGATGALLAPFLYSTFKIPMAMMSEVSYYYWTIPFSALSLVFWTVIYRPEDKNSKIHWRYLSFFLYGILIGFATFLRLYFLFLPIFMAPLIFIREKAVKKGIILLMLIFLGQSVFLVPQAIYNKKHFGKFKLSTRGHWHLFLQGVGFRPNPWGIKDSGEINLNEWAKAKGAPDMFKDNIESSEKWFKKEYFKMVKEYPEIFIGNFLRYLRGGLTVGTTDFQFFGLIANQGSGMFWLVKLFPWVVISALFFLFILSRDQFWMGIAVLLQGLYLLLVVVSWFANYIPFIASYIPAFILLLAMAVAIHIKVFVALIDGSIRCWINNSSIKSLPKIVVDCYREDWGVKRGL